MTGIGSLYCAGDAAIQQLIDGGVFKQWNQNGVVFCSYATVKVGSDMNVSKKEELRKAEGQGILQTRREYNPRKI